MKWYIDNNTLEITNKYYAKATQGTLRDCDIFIKYFPDDIRIAEIKARQEKIKAENEVAERKYYAEYQKSASEKTSLQYLQKFPEGLHYTEVNAYYQKERQKQGLAEKKKLEEEERMRPETELYHKAIKEGYYTCLEYINKYPQGKYIEEVRANKKIFDDREALVKKNMNTTLWKFGNRVCLLAKKPTAMLVCGVLENWNEDRSMAKIKLQSGMWDDVSQYNGEDLIKDKFIWITPKDGWHLCVQAELELLSENNSMPGNSNFQGGSNAKTTGANVAWYETYTVDNSDGTILGSLFSSLTNVNYNIRYTGIVEQELGDNYKVIITGASVDLGNWASANQIKYKSYVNEKVGKNIGQTRVLSKNSVKGLQKN